MVRFDARMAAVALNALIVACGEPHQPGPPPPASPPPPPPPASAPQDTGGGRYMWQSGSIAEGGAR